MTLEDRYATRLAALLHDIGHGPFSHATERLIEDRYQNEFNEVVRVLRGFFEGVTVVAPGEAIATLIVLGDAMGRVLTHPTMAASTTSSELPVAVAARILGSRSCLKAGYLSGIISGPVDADKLDYVARDCHHSGLPLGIDLTRLINKLEVVTVTPENAPNRKLRERAARSAMGRFYDIGISQTGLGSYEQLVIARVLLYDRLYYHHKVRPAESMLQSLIRVAEDERESQYSIRELFAGISDDVLVGAIGGEFTSTALQCGGKRSRAICQAIQERRIRYRAYAFAARFIAGIGSLPEREQQDTRALMWRRLIKRLSTDSGCREMARKIHEKAVELADAIPDLADTTTALEEEEILVDLPINRVVVRGGDMLTRTDRGHIGTPNLFWVRLFFVEEFSPYSWAFLPADASLQCSFRGDSNQASAYPRLSGGQPSLETVPNTVGLSPSGALPSGHSRGVLVRCRGKGGRPAMAVTTGFQGPDVPRTGVPCIDLPSRAPCAAADAVFADAKALLSSSEARQMSESELERELHRRGQDLVRKLLQGHRDQRSPKEAAGPAEDTSGVECSEPREHESHAETASGTMQVVGLGCARRGHDGLHRLDAALNLLPERYLVEMRRRVTIATASRAPPRTPWKPPWYSTSSTWQRRRGVRCSSSAHRRACRHLVRDPMGVDRPAVTLGCSCGGPQPPRAAGALMRTETSHEAREDQRKSPIGR